VTESAIVIIESLTVQHNPAQDRIAMFVRHADTEQVLFLTRRLTFGLLNALSQQIQHTQGDARLGCRKRELLVVPNPKTLKPYVSFFVAWDAARKKAGMPDVRIHDLPHSAASFLINANHSLYVVQKLLGHTQIKTTARYSHLAPETMLNAVDTMADAAGLGMTPVEPPAPPVSPVLRLIGQEEKRVA
jgi:integrase